MSTFSKRFFISVVALLVSNSLLAQTDSTELKSLSEVVVKSTRVTETSAFAFSNVYQKEIKKLNLGQDLPYLISQLPSVVVTSDGGTGIGYTGIRIRGTDPTRINVTLNGIPYNDSESQGVFWVDMPDFGSSVQSIQVQRGVGTSTNGAGAFGGSINVNTLQLNRKAFAEVNTSVGSFNTLKTNILASSGMIKDKFVLDARLSRIASDGFVDRAASNLKSFYISGGYYAKNSFVRLNVFSGHENTYQSWYGIPEALALDDKQGVYDFANRNGYSESFANDMLSRGRKYNFYNYKNQVDDYTQTQTQLILSLKIADNWRFNPSLFYTKGKGYYESLKQDANLANFGVVSNLETANLINREWLDNDFFGTVWSLDYEGKGKLKSTFGGGWNKYLGGHYGNVLSVEGLNQSDFGKYYDNNSIKTDGNIYAKTSYNFTPKLEGYVDFQSRFVGFSMNGMGSALQTLSNDKNYQFFNPKVGLSYKIKPSALLYISYGEGNKEPSRQDFVDHSANIPKPEKLKDTEAGIRFSTAKWRFETNLYYMDYINQLVLTGKINSIGESIRTNVYKSYRAGIEFQASGQLSPKLSVAANLTLSQNKIKNFEETVPSYDNSPDEINQYKNSAISFSPNVVAGGMLTYTPIKNLEMSLLPKYVSKQYLDNTSINSRKLDGFMVNNVRFSYTVPTKMFKDLNISVLINNVLNKKYQSNGYTYSYLYSGKITENFVFPQAGINFLTALRLRI